jgi:hypothetical protein
MERAMLCRGRKAMHQNRAKRVLSIALLGMIGAGIGAPASAQSAASPAESGASMVKPPRAPASGASAHNPDNMPIHRPKHPSDDPMARKPPASAVVPK